MKLWVPLTLFMLVAFLASLVLTEKRHRRTGVAFFLAWFMPGAGHLVLGRPGKAAALFLILAGLYVSGLWLGGWTYVSFDDNPFYYVGQFGSGITTLLAQVFENPKAFPREDLPTKWIDPALLYVCVAGLLNIVVTVGIFDAAKPAPAPPAEGPK
jgi:TM2 domain-containing membrane protein YozV